MLTADDITHIVYRPGDDSPITGAFLALPGTERLPYADEENLGRILSALRDEGVPSKSVLVLKEFPGRRFQMCPGSKGMICCNYRLLNTCFDCLFNCAYCYLNSYLNAYGIVQFTNLDDLADEIIERLQPRDDIVYRIGTGEFTDSLMMDDVTGIARDLITRLAPRHDIMLEFKTKSSRIDHLLDLPRKGNAVLAWSLNTQANIDRYEEGAASLRERLAAAEKAAGAGYFVAFHFDPVIRYDGFLEDYHRVIDEIFRRVDGSRIVWISLGCFRYGAGFRDIIRERFPSERMTLEEMFQGPDGKFRYLMHERAAIYRSMADRIGKHSEMPFVYMCMETAAMWRKVFGLDLSSSDDLERLMSRHLLSCFL